MHVPERLRALAKEISTAEISPKDAQKELERIAEWLERAGIGYVPPKTSRFTSSSCTSFPTKRRN